MSAHILKLPSWNRAIPFLLVLFLLVFPKGGIKIADVPLTWGYLLLTLTGFTFLIRGRFFLTREKIWVLLSLVPFQLVALFSFCLYGIVSVTFAIAFILSFFVLPWIFLFLLSHSIENLDFESFFRLLAQGVFFIAAYGIFLFFFKILTGYFLLIPFLTTNYHDMESIELTKSIARGDFFKLISTYQNGNIYGICLLMFLPLYNLIEKSRFKKFIVMASLFLTLSRTVWIGMFFYLLIKKFYICRVNLKTILQTAFQLLFFLLILSYILMHMDHDLSFIFDPSLGGRIEQFDQLSEWSFFPSKRFLVIAEIVYLSILNQFGLVGLVTFVLAITSPLIIYKFSTTHLQTWSESEYTLRKSLKSGLFLYLILCCSDGAMLNIPTMALYWFLSGLLLVKKPRLARLIPNFA